METTNQDVAEKVIKLVNSWRKMEVAKGAEAGLPMRQVYTQVRSTLPTMLKFSKVLLWMRPPYLSAKGGGGGLMDLL